MDRVQLVDAPTLTLREDVALTCAGVRGIVVDKIYADKRIFIIEVA